MCRRPCALASAAASIACYRPIAGADTITFMPNEVFAVFDTTEGSFKARLFAGLVPKTVENFVSLAEGTKTGTPFYDGLIFHRDE